MGLVVAQCVRAVAGQEPNSLNMILRSHVKAEGESTDVLWSLHTCHGMHMSPVAHRHTYTITN